MKVTAYKNTSKFHSYRVQRGGVDFDLTVGGVFKIEVVDQGEAISTETGDVTFSGTQINIRWGAFKLKPGVYYPTLYIYTPSMPEGEVLYGPGTNPIELELIEDEREYTATLAATLTQLKLSGPSKPIKSIEINGEVIDFAQYAGDLSALSTLPLTVDGVVEQIAIAPEAYVPEKYTYRFEVTAPNGVTKNYTKSWYI